VPESLSDQPIILGARGIIRKRMEMSEIVVTRDKQGSFIEAKKNDIIVFHLDENLTTGYIWEIEKAVYQPVVELVDSSYTEFPGKLLGRGGTRIMRFVAKFEGDQEIRLTLRRSWEPFDKAIEHLQVTVKVR